MQLPYQIESISAANAAHYEFLATVRKHTEEIQLDHDHWHRAVEEFRAVSDEAYAAVVFYTNAYFALNPDRREAADFVKRMSEDLDYFRKHAMSDPHKSKKEPQPDNGDAPADTVAAEAAVQRAPHPCVVVLHPCNPLRTCAR